MNLNKIIRSLSSNISAFDFGVLIVGFLCLIGFFLFFYRKSEYVTIRVKVTDQDVLYAKVLPDNWYAGRFEVGDTERDALGRVITQVTGVDTFTVNIDHKVVYLDLRVRATYDTRTKTYASHGNTLLFGTPIRFNLSQVTFNGYITEFPGWEKRQDYRVGSATVTALARWVEPSIADAIKEGNSITDNHNTELAKILSIVTKPADTVTNTAGGQLLLQQNPLYKDLVLTLKIRTKTYKGETYFFDNIPLKVGVTIPLDFKNVNLMSVSPQYQERTNTYPIITEFVLDK